MQLEHLFWIVPIGMVILTACAMLLWLWWNSNNDVPPGV